MASTTNSVPSTNGAPGNAVNSQMAQNATGTRPPLRASTGLKGSDGGRRQSGSPSDGGQRRNNPPKAWTQNTNPITQKPAYPHQNGGAAHRKSTMSPKPASTKESNTPDMHAHDRLVFIMTACIGLNATITTKSGDKYTGIFSSSVLESNATSFMLKMVQRSPSLEPNASSNGLSDRASPFLGSAPDHQMTFEVQDVADVSVPELSAVGMAVKSQNGQSVGFKTDTDISGGQAGRERELQRWEPGPDTDVDLSLESTSTAHWDQFEANARLFGATSSYDENLYTTRIDRSDPSYKHKEAQAAKIAREIESSDTDNVHMREERGLAPENDNIGEEEKYSGVRRDKMNFTPLQSGQPNKYTPPARRAPTAQPTVTGAPVDPAIISAQMARPDAQTKPSQAKNFAPPVAKSIQAPQDKGTEPAEAAPPGKLATDLEPSKTSGKPTAATTDQPTRKGGVENASSNVEAEVLDHFRQFANNEKMKVQERRRNQASYDRNLKLNELMKFSQNFKLRTPVPKDLVPILAKDRSKQEEIVAKAMKEAEETKASEKAAASAPPAEQKSAPRPNGPAQYSANTAPLAPSDRQQYSRGRQGFPPMGPHFGRGGGPNHPHTAHPRSGPGHLSHRLADIQQQRKGAGMGPVPPPLSTQDARAPPTGPMADHSGVTSPQKPMQSPTSAVSTKFNVRALEFKPNPTASTFTPGGATPHASSPALNAHTRSISRTTSPSAFFGNKKPLPASERSSIKEHFNPVKRMKKEASEQSTKDYAFNGGIPPAYRTLPTWDVAPANEETKYTDLFKPATNTAPMMPQNRPASNHPIPHQPHMPYNQGGHNMPPNAGPPHVNQHLHPQHHPASGPPHFDEHQNRMQISVSSSQAYPSPRLQQSHMAYQSPMAPHAQLAYGQPGPQFYVGQGPQPPHMRHYPGGPQFVAPQNGVGAPMMVQQPSNGPYMGVPQGMGTPYNPPAHMYSPGPQHVYPQHVQPPPHPHSGYPSPSRGAPMMMHQGSQQGQPPQPVMYMNPNQHGQPPYPGQQPAHMPPARPGYPQHQQPHFSSSPHQGHHYPHQQHRVQSNNYNHMPHMPPPHMQHQGLPQNPQSAHHPAEAPEEVK